ncbi:MAG: CoA ester lyase [Rhodospirillales bacterium]|nr:CoA ester lyase [Rhodospirillales bacterium]
MTGRQHKERPLWRSQLIVPVNVEKYVARAHTRGADAIILDLEDSITPAEKMNARGLVADAARHAAIGGADILVRINRPLELAVRDIETVVSPSVVGLVLPKVETASHVRLLAEVVDVVEAQKGLPNGHTRFVVLIETAEAFFHMREIAGAHERVNAVSLGSEDFTLATHSQPDPDVLLYPKQQVVIAAYAAGVLPLGVIGSVATYQDIEGYRRAIARSRRFGFQGGSCIHPAIVPLLNAGFAPSQEEIAEADRMIAGFEEAKTKGRGSVSVDGKMVDIPVVLRARQVLDIAGRIKALKPASEYAG